MQNYLAGKQQRNKSVPCRVESIGQATQESMTTQLANTESPIIDLGIIINNHQAAASSKTSEIIIALTALIKEDGEIAPQKSTSKLKAMEKGQLTNSQGKDQTRKSKETASTPARGSRGQGTVMEKGQSTTMLGKDQSYKSKEITTTPARRSKGTGAFTPGDQSISEREQQSSKKKREEQKQTMDQYFGGGERVQPLSKGGTPIQSILLRRLTKTPERTTGTDDTVEMRHNLDQSDNEGEGAATEAGNMEVDLKGFMPGVWPKENGSKKRDKKREEERTTKEQVKKTKARKPKIAFGPTEVEKEIPIAYKECIVGFAIRVDKGNNAKQAFDKKLMEGLEFIQQYVDKCTCFLPHKKDNKLKPIRAKNDMPKYQVVMKGYFCIPNNNSFSSVQQENGRVVKSSGIMGFKLDPQQCLEEASRDLPTHDGVLNLLQEVPGGQHSVKLCLSWCAKLDFRRHSERNRG